MAFATVRKIGDSLMLELPRELEKELYLVEGAEIEVETSHRKLRARNRKYSLDELLAQSDYSQPMTDEEREWVDSPAVGRELI